MHSKCPLINYHSLDANESKRHTNDRIQAEVLVESP
jgi:hypothetical protein